MGVELSALIVLLVISIFVNIAFIGYWLFLRRSAKSQGHKPDVEIPVQNEPLLAPRVAAPEPPPQQEKGGEEDGQKKTIVVEPTDAVVKTSPKETSPKHALRSLETEQRPELNVKKIRVREPQQRSNRQRLREPVSKIEFKNDMELVVQFVNEYFDESHKLPVIPENDVSTSRLYVDIPEDSEECCTILKDIKEVVVPNTKLRTKLKEGLSKLLPNFQDVLLIQICHTQHPRYHAKFHGKSLADILGSTVSSALVCDVNSSPVIGTIETIVCKWLGTALALPKMKREYGSGRLVNLQDPVGAVFYTTHDVYVTLIRHAKIKKLAEDKTPNDQKRFVVYCSDDASRALEEACCIEKVKLRQVITFDKEMCGMTVKHLEKQMEKDATRGLVPLLIVANYGSANIAANDEVWELVKTSRSSLIPDTHSIHVSFSSLFPYSGQISIVWSCERLEHAKAKAIYNEENPIRLWVLIRLYGIRSIREAVKRKLMLGNGFTEHLAQHSEFFDMHYGNEHGVSVFQYNNFHGKVLIRAVINYERCHQSIMEESVSTLLNSVDEFEKAISKGKKGLNKTPDQELCETIGGSANETTDNTQSDEGEKNELVSKKMPSTLKPLSLLSAKN
uniref:Uncharacterized protein n=1 Tax=Caenorhabditis japonica TaxID=281687 RepID=A0A8R1I7A3_CAEJA